MTKEYKETLAEESEKAKQFKSKHVYSPDSMGLDLKQITKEFGNIIHDYQLEKETQS